MDVADFLNQISEESSNATPQVYSKTVLSNKTKSKLFAYQEKPVIKLITILLQFCIALDLSSTGVGKTFLSAAVCAELKRRPIIICPKTLIYNWVSVLAYFGVKAYDIVNYETIRNGKTYATSKYKSRTKSPFVDVLEPDPENKLKPMYKWNLPKDAIIIFDESHRCKDIKTDNGKLLLSTKQAILEKIPVLLLSATICEKFSDMKIPFCLLGFIPNTRNYNHYIKTLKSKYPKYKVLKHNYGTKTEFIDAKANAQALMIYEEIKDYASRIKIEELGDMFPRNQICSQLFVADETDKICEAYEEMGSLLKDLKDNPGPNHLSRIQKLKQEIELRKVPIFIEQAQIYLEDGKSVIIFVNYLDSLNLLADKLNIKCKIHGSQTMEERQKAINLFQSNEEKIIILQMRSGGIGISLHDLSGNHPRVSLLNFPDDASTLIQALGRPARAGAKSIVLQRIIFVANVDYEKVIMNNINRKLRNVSAINDGDFDGYRYNVKKIVRKVIKKNAKPIETNVAEDKAIINNLA